jgi:mortality factor 4-like protein 1
MGFPTKYHDWINEDKISRNETVLDSKKKKKKTESNDVSTKIEISPNGLVMPNALAELMKKDSKFIHKNKEYELPRDLTIQNLLQDFADENADELEQYQYFSMGVENYFNNVCGKTLLYKSERNQYASLETNWETNVAIPSTLYGIEHLLRLLTKFPRYLDGNIGTAGQDLIFQMTIELVRFLEKRSSYY